MREEWERLDATLENVGNPIPVTDHNSSTILMNREAERLLEAPPEDESDRDLQRLNEEPEDRIKLATVELEERNRRLEWQSRELEKASRLKSEFLASMSHELRTPINAVIGYTSLLREEIYGALTDKQKNGLDKVDTASQHSLDLINDILDPSRIEAGKNAVKFTSEGV